MWSDVIDFQILGHAAHEHAFLDLQLSIKDTVHITLACFMAYVVDAMYQSLFCMAMKLQLMSIFCLYPLGFISFLLVSLQVEQQQHIDL